MRKPAIALLLALAALPLAAGDKVKSKQPKEKRFDPVAIARPADAAGRYVGIDPDFIIVLSASGGGSLRNFERTAKLADVTIDGSELRATAVYADGQREPLHATFVNRTKNGEVAFGLLLRDPELRIDDSVTLQNLFCRRE